MQISIQAGWYFPVIWDQKILDLIVLIWKISIILGYLSLKIFCDSERIKY